MRAGALWCTWIADPDAAPPRVAYAIGRAVGGAVVRNRLRRQLRARVAAAARDDAIGPGWYLVGAAPAAARASRHDLDDAVAALLRSIGAQVSR